MLYSFHKYNVEYLFSEATTNVLDNLVNVSWRMTSACYRGIDYNESSGYIGKNYISPPVTLNLTTLRSVYTEIIKPSATSDKIGYTRYQAIRAGYTRKTIVRRNVISIRRGEYIETIQTQNPNQYPHNGIQGDFWYIKVAEVTEPEVPENPPSDTISRSIEFRVYTVKDAEPEYGAPWRDAFSVQSKVVDYDTVYCATSYSDVELTVNGFRLIGPTTKRCLPKDKVIYESVTTAPNKERTEYVRIDCEFAYVGYAQVGGNRVRPVDIYKFSRRTFRAYGTPKPPKKTRGDYIYSIYESIPSRYPSNGVQGDYWYVRVDLNTSIYFINEYLPNASHSYFSSIENTALYSLNKEYNDALWQYRIDVTGVWSGYLAVIDIQIVIRAINAVRTYMTGRTSQQEAAALNAINLLQSSTLKTKLLKDIDFIKLCKAVSQNIQVYRGSTGYSHSFYITSENVLYGWGLGEMGRLGYGGTSNILQPIEIPGIQAKLISAGHHHSLCIDIYGRVWAWGDNYRGRLGDGTTTYRTTPVLVQNLSSISIISAGESHSLALDTQGRIWAWGDNYRGQLGIGRFDEEIGIKIPTQVISQQKFIAISAGGIHTLALDVDGYIWACGANQYGQLGLGDTTYRHTLEKINTSVRFIRIATGVYHSLAIDENGKLWVWGRNYYGQLGLGHQNNRLTPTMINTPYKFELVSSADSHTIALDEYGRVWGWGWNNHGQIKYNEPETVLSPVQIMEGDFIAIGAGGLHSMAVTENGIAYSWGNNTTGQHGNGTTESSQEPSYLIVVPAAEDPEETFPIERINEDPGEAVLSDIHSISLDAEAEKLSEYQSALLAYKEDKEALDTCDW